MNGVAPSPLTDKADVVRGVTFAKGDAVTSRGRATPQFCAQATFRVI